jgi:hypothetical protein
MKNHFSQPAFLEAIAYFSGISYKAHRGWYKYKKG